MQIWWNKQYFKANLVILKIIWNTAENIELLLIKMAHFHMHHFFLRHAVLIIVNVKNA